jgi:hypothetical protein
MDAGEGPSQGWKGLRPGPGPGWLLASGRNLAARAAVTSASQQAWNLPVLSGQNIHPEGTETIGS